MSYRHNVLLLNSDGTTVEYKDEKIGKYFSLSEDRFQKDIYLYGEVVLCDPLFKVLNHYREIKGKPINLNSLNRDKEKQKELLKAGFRAAQVSPHEYFLAADCDTENVAETLSNVPMIRQAANELGIKVRIGYSEYIKSGQSFIHVDVCPEYFGKGKCWANNPHPKQWETSNEW